MGDYQSFCSHVALFMFAIFNTSDAEGVLLEAFIVGMIAAAFLLLYKGRSSYILIILLAII
jgi:hypothetical protein